ncbi:MAG: hypothetical protein ACK559_19565 [bacterium]
MPRDRRHRLAIGAGGEVGRPARRVEIDVAHRLVRPIRGLGLGPGEGGYGQHGCGRQQAAAAQDDPGHGFASLIGRHCGRFTQRA